VHLDFKKIIWANANQNALNKIAVNVFLRPIYAPNAQVAFNRI
jgi:hypothetical protein